MPDDAVATPLLRNAIARIEQADRPLADELRGVRERARAAAAAARGLESRGAGQRSLETIVLRVGRPVLAIVNGEPRFEPDATDGDVWSARLQAAAEVVKGAAAAVGRIEVAGHPELQWVGTGWLVDRDVVLTNRHVAREFAHRGANGFRFRQGVSGVPIDASIDFLREVDRADRLEQRIVGVLHIEDEDGPDLAFLRIDARAGALAQPIPLDEGAVEPRQQIAVIGYPARDSRIPDQRLMQSIFGDVYDRKRLAPGQITGVDRRVLLHDCSTLGGNSGSVLFDLASGRAVGLHFAGRFLQANYAVPAAVVAGRLHEVRRRPAGVAPAPLPPPGGVLQPAPAPVPVAPVGDAETEPELFVEGRVSDYEGRPGYDAAFLGVGVPLPSVSDLDDLLLFPADGRQEHELKYQHFSVVMSRGRRVCFFSAVNIDGGRSRRGKRPPWRTDPRIPSTQQIRDEDVYGNAPRFSRGHMTRREDPIWGTPEESALGNQDSMHVTNTVPQMQPFNAGIWLGLENYALEHARQDDMRLSVFTGPFLHADDPRRFQVQVPRAFWKVIAFILDGTDTLCATGYTMSQEDFLREEEFVFGQHRTAQIPVRTIEQRAGVSFGPLADADPLAEVDEGVATALTDFAQIVFRRG